MQLNDFTAQECVIAVFGDKLKRPSKHKYYGLICRHLNQLVGMGLLNRRSVGNKWFSPNYVKKPQFDKVIFQEDLPSSEVPVTPVEQKAIVEVRNEGIKVLEAMARSYRFELQEYQATFAEYCELRTDFSALDQTIENVLRHTSQEYRCLRGRLAAVEEVITRSVHTLGVCF